MKLKSSARVDGTTMNPNEAIASQAKGFRVKTNVKAGGVRLGNHNETLVGQPKKGLRVRTKVRAGGVRLSNHNETIVRKPRSSR